MKRLLPALAILCLSVFTSFGQNVGVGNTSPNSKLDLSGDLALREGTAISVTAGANTITLPSAKNSVYRLTGATGAFSITSISGGNDGMILTLINATGQIMTVTNGTIQTNTGANLVASSAVATVNLIYNATLGKWLVVSGEGFTNSTGWNLTGNAGTTSSNFVGTTDNNPLYFKTNGSVVGYLPSSSNSSGNTGFGVGNGTPGGSYNVFMGFHTLAAGNTGNGNVSFGWNVLDVNSTGHDNIGMGFQPLAYNTTGAFNVALGSSVLMFNKTGSNNVGIGPSSLQSDTTGGNNVAVGDNALNALYNGTNNTALGNGAGSTATGSNNVFLGYNAGANELTSNKLYISNSNTASPLVYGDFTNKHLTVNDSLSAKYLQLTNGATSGYLLQSDASGNGTWVSPSSIAATNVYNSDGTLTGSRTVTMGSSNLTLNTAGGNLVFSPSGTHGYVGIGTTSPICLLASTPTNILGSDNHGIVAASLAWAVNDGGYTAAFYNGDNAYSADGLAVQIAGTSSNNRILDLSTSPTQGTAGTTVMAVLGTGNVGIGTGSPQQMLSVNTGMNIDQAGGNTGTVSSNALTFGNGSGEGMASNRNAGVNQFGLDFYTDYTNRLAITNSGNVGIGTTSPGSTLTVNGTTSTSNFQMTNGGTSGYILQSDASGNGTWVNPSTSLTNIYNSDGTLTGNRTVNIGANTLVFTNGTVGITSAHLGLGTATPYGNFDYEGTNSAFHLYDFSGSPTVLSAELHANSSLGALLRFTGPASGYMDIGQDSTGSFIIAQGSTGFTRFALNQYTGYVGIGTTTPSSTLQVNGKTTTTNLEMTNGANTGYIMQSDASGNASWVSPLSVTTGTTHTLSSSANVITSTVNGVAATANAVNSVANTSTGNTISTTVNGVAGTAVTVPNIYTADGTLTGARTMTMGGYALNLNGGTLTTNQDASINGLTVGIGAGGQTNNTVFGSSAMHNNTTGGYNTAIGYQSMLNNNNGANNTAVGYGALTANSNGSGNTATGYDALWSNNSGTFNTAVGYGSLAANTGAYYNTGIGGYAITANVSGGSNAGLGFATLYKLTSGSNNTGTGFQALYSDLSGGNNVASGYQAGYNILGSGNVLLGYQAGYNETGSNKLYIANSSTATPLIYGDFTNKHLTINDSLTAKYLQMTSGATAGYLLQSDASGNASWVSPSSVTTATTNTLTNTTNTITSTVNGVAATAPAVNTVSNAISGNTVSTTVNGIAGTAVTLPNIYTADGTLAGNRTVTQGADNMTFSSTTGNFVYSTTSTGGNVSMGYNNTVSGGNAVAIGSGSTANAVYATAFGFGNTASGQYSTAMGSNSTASGKGSFTNGYGLTAASYNETALGTSNTSYTPTSATAWSATDRLFGVGNGSSPASPSDAFVILKNGNTGVGTASPSSTLQVNGKTTTTNFEMTNGATNGYILKSDASGNASWVNPTSITTATTNALSLSTNTLTSTVNGVAATSNAVSGVSNTSSGNALSTTVNGVAGSGVNIINSNTSAWTQSGGLVNTINGVAATTTPASGTITNILGYNASGAPVYQAISGLAESVSNTVSGNTISTTVDATTGTAVTVPNIYTANGTLTGARTVTMAADNLTFSSTTGNLIFSPSSTGYIGVNTASPQSLLANTATNIIGADGNGVNTPSLTWAMNTNGYTGAFYNASTATNAMGLAVKIAGTASTNKLLDLSTGATQNTSGTSVMVVLGNGTVGIGTATPTGNIGFTNNGSNIAWGNGALGPYTSIYDNGNIHYWTDDVTNYESLSAGTTAAFNWNAGVSATGSGGSTWMTLTNARLGIGTTSPNYPLDVTATVATSITGYGYLNSGGGTGYGSGSSGTNNYSIHSAGRIVSAEVDVQSDRRIKTNISDVDASSMLDKANALHVVNYNYVDKFVKGSNTKTGFIAQELETVLPEAVNRSKEVIPSVFAAAKRIHTDGTTLTVTTELAHGFAEGDEILLYDKDNKPFQVQVASVVDTNTFTVNGWTEKTGNLFVYGKKVSDFRAVDFDQVTAVAIGAVQELNKKVQALEQKNSESEARNEKLQKELNVIKTAKASAAELEQLKAEVETLKQILGAKAEK